MDHVPFNMDHVPSHMDNPYMELVLLNMVHVPSNHVLSKILCNNFKTQPDDHQGHTRKTGSIQYWPYLFPVDPVCHLYEAGCFGCINAILS